MIVLSLSPVVFFLAHVADPDFLSTTMGNWFATMVGVLVGVPVGLFLTRIQQREAEMRETTKQAKIARERLTHVLKRAEAELRKNRSRVEALQEALGNIGSATHDLTDLWKWAKAIVESFSFTAKTELLRTGLQDLLPGVIEDALYCSYEGIFDVTHQVRQAAASYPFYRNYGGTHSCAETYKQLCDIRESLSKLLADVESTIEKLDAL